jgi:hypothetical protein
MEKYLPVSSGLYRIAVAGPPLQYFYPNQLFPEDGEALGDSGSACYQFQGVQHTRQRPLRAEFGWLSDCTAQLP